MHLVVLPPRQSDTPITALPFPFLKHLERAVDANSDQLEWGEQGEWDSFQGPAISRAIDSQPRGRDDP